MSLTDDNGESYRFYFATSSSDTNSYTNAAGISGARNGKLYDCGLLLKAIDEKYEVKEVYIQSTNPAYPSNTYYFIVNSSGSIQTSQKDYEEDDDVLIHAQEDEATIYKDAPGAFKGYVEFK